MWPGWFQSDTLTKFVIAQATQAQARQDLDGASVAATHPWLTYSGAEGPGRGKHVVLIAADQEYRSEQSMPMLAKVLSKHHGFDCTADRGKIALQAEGAEWSIAAGTVGGDLVFSVRNVGYVRAAGDVVRAVLLVVVLVGVSIALAHNWASVSSHLGEVSTGAWVLAVAMSARSAASPTSATKAIAKACGW